MAIYMMRDDGRTPWANTLAYYKFESNLNDSSGNWHTLTNGWTSVSYEIGSAPSVYLTRQNWLHTSWSDSFNHDWTMSCWTYFVERTPEVWILLSRGTGAQRKMIICGVTNSGQLFFWFYDDDYTWSTTIPLNQSHHLCFTYNYTSKAYKGYIDWVVDISWTLGTQYSIGSSDLFIGDLANNTSQTENYRIRGNVGQFILESKERSATDVLNYYNDTKWTYQPS